MVSGGGGLLGGLAPGSRVAGYLLEEQVGAGGMAVVFRAVDERLGRQVALKVLAPALASDEEFRRRFIRESQAAAAVDDPHIVPVYEAGEADGVLFIAMRYVAGGDVHALLRRERRLPPDRAAAIISSVASALDAAHAAGLVHRDVKPTNMLLDARPERPDHVYLADFGLTRGPSSPTLTGLGIFLGTPDYVAPEQIEGKPVTGQADQYALACAAFEMLTGQTPFRRDEARAVIWSHLAVPPPSLTSLRPGLPTKADHVLARALAKNPAERYPRCADFAEALRGALGLAPYAHRVTAGPEPAGGHPAEPLAPAGAAPASPEPSEPPAADHASADHPGSPLAAIPAEQTQTVAAWPAQAQRTMPPQARSDRGPATGRTVLPDRPGPGKPGGPRHPVPPGPRARPAPLRGRLVAGTTLAVVVVAYLVIAAAARTFPFAQPGPSAANPAIGQSSPQITHPELSLSPLTAPPPTPTSFPVWQIASLAQLLPGDIPLSSCTTVNPAQYQFAVLQSTQVLDCQSGNWQVNAFQFLGTGNLVATLYNFNHWIGLDPSTAGTSCPPQGGATGSVPWRNKYFPPYIAQTLECFTYHSGSTPYPSYAWTFPDENAFIWVTGNAGTTWSELDAWWQANETQAVAPPSPSPAA